MYWHRVQEPTGTTNMDFEFNQSRVVSGNGVTPVRTAGDLLIQYDLASGGTHPELFLSEWVTSGPKSLCEAANSTPCWGVRENLTTAGLATGSINTSAIPSTESDGLGNISPRTFGEATVDFDALAGTDPCVGFGSAYLKSRASDSFTAALKDFIAPKALNIDQCGAIQITKTAKHKGPAGSPNLRAGFTIKDSNGNQVGSEVFTDATTGKVCVDKLQLGSYTVQETTVPSGYTGDPATKTVNVNNTATCGATPYAGETVSFTNTPLSDITVSFNSQVTGGTAATIDCTGLTATPADGTPAAFDDTSETFKNLAPGTYNCTVVVDP
jgi:hypothetical protein